MQEEIEEEKEKKIAPKKDSEEEHHPAEEQGILPEETSEEIKEDMELGEKEENVYSKEGREKLVEDGEIDPEEAGFMQGAENAGQLGKDALTGEPLLDADNIYETEIEGKVHRFANEGNAQKFRERKRSEEE
jgi:hypothetical protein